VGPGQLDSVQRLFSRAPVTRHCWCMAFCSTRWQFATGWYGGGNQRRFETMAAADPHPMGVWLSVTAGPSDGWRAVRAPVTSRLWPVVAASLPSVPAMRTTVSG